MISLYDAQITDILPGNLTVEANVIAISFAINQAMQKLLNYAEQVRTYAAIQNLPDSILDILAEELRTPYYDESLSIETKRNIIQNTMLWYRYAGTPSAVEELITTVLGKGKVIEWFNYKEGPGEPGTFIIETSAALTSDILDKLNIMIKGVKNTRSHLTKINVISDLQEKKYIGICCVSIPKVVLRDGGI